MRPSHKPSRSEFLPIRGLRYHVRHWGAAEAPALFMLHGWMDMSASFQFLVDALRTDWHVIAPDWRGFGQTEWATDGYWFPDYLADLDCLLDHYSSESAVNLLGHSLGGNVALCYAGVRPERIARLVNLEGFGLPATQAQQAPGRYAQWLDQLRSQRHTPLRLGHYANLQGAAARLQQSNPRLNAARAAFLAAAWAHRVANQTAGETESRFTWQADPRHKNINPVLYRLDEMLACWQQIQAPVLWVTGAESGLLSRVKAGGDYARRLASVPHARVLELPEAGHMVQHDQPEILGAEIEKFLLDRL